MGPLFVNDEQYRTMLIEQLGVTDFNDPLLTADSPILENAVLSAGMALPIVRRRAPVSEPEPQPVDEAVRPYPDTH